MINPEIIKGLYIRYPQPSQNSLNFELLTKGNLNHHTPIVTQTDLVINNLDSDNPFYQIPLKNIAGIEELENHIAIVLRNSILFL